MEGHSCPVSWMGAETYIWSMREEDTFIMALCELMLCLLLFNSILSVGLVCCLENPVNYEYALFLFSTASSYSTISLPTIPLPPLPHSPSYSHLHLVVPLITPHSLLTPLFHLHTITPHSLIPPSHSLLTPYSTFTLSSLPYSTFTLSLLTPLFHLHTLSSPLIPPSHSPHSLIPPSHYHSSLLYSTFTLSLSFSRVVSNG